MTYALGVDLGTTFTAAATWRGGKVEMVSLGTRTTVIPSVVLVREDGTMLTGEAASRRGLTEPERVARGFKRRLGDPTPIWLGGSPYAAEALMAALLRAVVDQVAQQEGGPPSRICLSHPASWTQYKQDLFARAVGLAGLDGVTYITEPQAAALFYAHQQRVEPGAMVAVYDLGGGTFDAAVLRKTAAGFELIGAPEGIEWLGGMDFDTAVFAHVRQTVGDALAELDEEDPAAQAAVARLREECTAAKETLSSDTDVTIPVLLPVGSSEVRLTRAELEAMVRPSLRGSVEALRRALRTAEVPPDQLHSVLLVGGASRMPIVAQLVGAELGRPVAVDAHPKHAVALGAAYLASGETQPRAATDTTVLTAPAQPAVPTPPATPAPPPPAVPAQPAGPAPARPAPPPAGPGGRRRPAPAPTRVMPAAVPTGPAGPRPSNQVGRAGVAPAAPGPQPPGPAPGPPVQGQRRRWLPAAAAAVALAVLVGVGAYALTARDDPAGAIAPAGETPGATASPTGEPTTTSPPEPTRSPAMPAPVTTAPAEPETVEVSVYFLWDGRLVAVRRTRPFTLATSRLALTELIAGPTADEIGLGTGSAVPGDLGFDVSISDGIASVYFPSRFYEAESIIEEEAGIVRLRQAQVVFTLTQFDSVSAVLFHADGEPLPPPATRDDYADLAP